MGKGTNTTTTQQTPNSQAMAAYGSVLGQASNVAQLPFQTYSGQFTAPVNSQQYTGIGNINANAGFAQPYIQQATGYANAAAQPINANTIAQYSSPYTQQVVQATENQFNNQNAQQQSQLVGNAAAQGALGGDRVGVAQANLAGQQQTAQAPVIAGLENQGYQTGLSTALAEQSNLGNAAYNIGNLGVAGQTAALTGANAQVGAGSLEQQTQQAQDAALYNQFEQQQAYPFQVASWEAGIDSGIGSQMGGTSTTTGPQPSLASQLGGLGIAGVGLAGATGGFGQNGWVGQLGSSVGSGVSSLGAMFVHRGGRVAGFAPGGSVAPPPYVRVAGFAPGGSVWPHHRTAGVAGFDAGGGVSPMPYAGFGGSPNAGVGGSPYGNVAGFVPMANIAHGHGAPPPPSAPPQSSAMQMIQQAGQLASAFKGFSGNQNKTAGFAPPVGSFDWSPTGQSGSSGAIYARGGKVAGFADGGDVADDVSGGVAGFGPLTEDDLAAIRNAQIGNRARDAGPEAGVSAARFLAPNLTDYLTKPAPTPAAPVPGYVGKIPEQDPFDPRIVPAAKELGDLGLSTVGGPLGRLINTASAITPARAADDDLSKGVLQVFGPRPSASPEETDRLKALNEQAAVIGQNRQKAIDAAVAKAVKDAGKSNFGPKARQTTSDIAASPFDAQLAKDAPINSEISAINAQLLARQNDYDAKVSDYIKQTAPLAKRDPTLNQYLGYAPAASGLTGLATGLVSGSKSPLKTLAGAGLMGGLEGAMGAYGPTFLDSRMPDNTAAKAQADARMDDPEARRKYLEHVVFPEVGFSGGAGMAGAELGMLAGKAGGALGRGLSAAYRALRSPSPAIAPSLSAASSVLSPAEASAVASVGKVIQDDAGRWRTQAGRFTKPPQGARQRTPKASSPSAPDINSAPLSPALMGPEMRAKGGKIAGFADGGYADVESPTAPNFAGIDQTYGTPSIVPQAGFGPTGFLADPAAAYAANADAAYPLGDIDPAMAPENNYGFDFNPVRTNANRSYDQVPIPQPRPDRTMLAYADQDTNTADSPATPGGSPTGGVGGDGGYQAYLDRLMPSSPVAAKNASAQAGFGGGNALWPSLMAAGFGMMASKSPFPGVAIGEGGLQGIHTYSSIQQQEQEQKKSDASIEQGRQRLEMEAQKTAAQMAQEDKKLAQEKDLADTTKNAPHVVGTDELGRQIYGVRDPKTGNYVNPVSREPITLPHNSDLANDPMIKRTAAMYNIIGPTALTNLGRGAQSGAVVQAVKREAARQDDEAGVTAQQRAQLQAEYQGNKAAQRTLGVQEAKMGNAAFEAEGAINLGRDVINKVPRTSFLPFNQLIQGYQRQTLNPDQAELYARTQGIVNAYSAVMARGANVTTDASRHRAEDLLNTAADPATYNRVLDTMLSEIDMAKNAPERMRQFYMQKYGNRAGDGASAPSGGAPATGPAAPANTPAARVKQNGHTYERQPDGTYKAID